MSRDTMWAVLILIAIAVIVAALVLAARAALAWISRSRDTLLPHHPPSRSAPARAPFRQRWFGPAETLEIGAHRLDRPCVYASSTHDVTAHGGTDPSEIILDLPLQPPRESIPDLPYWPSYAQLTAEQRWAYVTWLASDRSMLPDREGYLFLYYYGIERRLLIDDADREWGLQEIERLRRLDAPRVGTRAGRSFRQYSSALIWFELARCASELGDRWFEAAVVLTERWTPEILDAALAWIVVRDRSLPAWIARQIAANDPASVQSVVTTRVAREFDELFATRYHEAFGPTGMTLRIAKRPRVIRYRPASSGLAEMKHEVPSPMGIRSQFKRLTEIWNSCVADLRRYSRASAKMESTTLTVAAWDAMPEELRAEIDHPMSEVIATLVARSLPESNEDGEADDVRATIEIADLASELALTERTRLTLMQSRNIAQIVEYAGFGIVPDARLTPIRYRWRERVALIPGLGHDELDPDRFGAAVCVLRLGLSIALADGDADEFELRVLTDHIDAVFDLSTQERQRLEAMRSMILRDGEESTPIAQRIEASLPVETRRRIGRLLVVIAAATDGIDRRERTALRKAFRMLELAPDLLEQAIADVLPDAGAAPVVVRKATPQAAGERLPEAPVSSFRLNHEAIGSIMSETRDVSVMLAEAMGLADDDADGDREEDEAGGVPVEAPVAEVNRTASESTPSAARGGPAGRYGEFFQVLIRQDRWSRDEADELARASGVMLDAGIEAINDWAYDEYGAPLFEDDGDDIILDSALLDE